MIGPASIQGLIIASLIFINNVLVPVILAIAFLVFLWNIANYFIIKSGSDADRQRAKDVAIYGIAAFVIIVSLWGIVNLLVGGFGFTNTTAPIPDYIRWQI